MLMIVTGDKFSLFLTYVTKQWLGTGGIYANAIGHNDRCDNIL